jgi:hypothetical protein
MNYSYVQNVMSDGTGRHCCGLFKDEKKVKLSLYQAMEAHTVVSL